jgi:YfiH family protein
VSGAECFHRSLFCGESGRERRSGIALASAVSDFLVSEDTIDEPIAVPFDGGSNPRDFGRIDARTYDFHLRRSYMTLPAVPETFYWTDSPCGLALKCRPLDDVARHLFTTRELQLSFDGAWERIGGALGVGEVAGLNQVHGRDVVSLRSDSPRVPGPCSGDALVCNDTRVAVAVRAADCVPLLLADPECGAVAAVHAGWRGTAAGVATAAVEALTREFGTRPADLVVAIGPSIGACCYEVGSELVDAFAAAGHPRYLIDRWFVVPPAPRGSQERSTLKLDVAGANRDQLVLAGVREESVFLCGLCTAMHLDVLTSYRAEKERAGRLVGAIAPL